MNFADVPKLNLEGIVNIENSFKGLYEDGVLSKTEVVVHLSKSLPGVSFQTVLYELGVVV